MRCSVCWRSAVLPLSSSDDLCSSTARRAASPYSPAPASRNHCPPLRLHIQEAASKDEGQYWVEAALFAGGSSRGLPVSHTNRPFGMLQAH